MANHFHHSHCLSGKVMARVWAWHKRKLCDSLTCALPSPAVRRSVWGSLHSFQSAKSPAPAGWINPPFGAGSAACASREAMRHSPTASSSSLCARGPRPQTRGKRRDRGPVPTRPDRHQFRVPDGAGRRKQGSRRVPAGGSREQNHLHCEVRNGTLMSHLAIPAPPASTLPEQSLSAFFHVETMNDLDDGRSPLLTATETNLGDLRETSPARALGMLADARAQLDQIGRASRRERV